MTIKNGKAVNPNKRKNWDTNECLMHLSGNPQSQALAHILRKGVPQAGILFTANSQVSKTNKINNTPIYTPMKTKIFISGKISGLHYYYAYHKFATAEKHLERMGYKVVNPMCLCKRDWSWARCMILCLLHLLHCQSIYMLENWEYSRGAKIEYRIARLLNKKIIFQKY